MPTIINNAGERVDITESELDRAPSVSQRQQAMTSQARQQFEASLQRGYTFDGGTWAPVDEERDKVQRLVLGIAAGKGLPGTRTTVTLKDVDGGLHVFTESQVTDLADAANSLMQDADERLSTLIEQIEQATTQADLDAIDPATGWPN